LAVFAGVTISLMTVMVKFLPALAKQRGKIERSGGSARSIKAAALRQGA
jgi:hypothetical protein